MRRNIIEIDEAKCDGCGQCLPGCPEGALQIVNGKARLAEEVLCDGLGACLGHCPRGAIRIIEKEAQAYDEGNVIRRIRQTKPEAVPAHLAHLREQEDPAHLGQALEVLAQSSPSKAGRIEHGPIAPRPIEPVRGCPGSRSQFLVRPAASVSPAAPSALTHWPIQLHLLNPLAPQYQGADVLLAADCTAFAAGGFHSTFLPGKSLMIACPKLDQDQDRYRAKITALIEQAGIRSLTVMIMEVPCCGGLLTLVLAANRQAKSPVPVKRIVLSLTGAVLDETWVPPRSS
jgi:NAD-dependent dihydropyrimidine dehydrogenase PreA subunit